MEKAAKIEANIPPVVLDRRGEFIFFANFKCGYTSIVRNALKGRAVVRKSDKKRWRNILDGMSVEDFKHAFKFKIVRNPYDRAVSAFIYLKKKELIDKKWVFRDFVKRELQNNRELEGYNDHFHRQVNGIEFVDYVGRLEDIDHCWKVICRNIGRKYTKLPKKNVSKGRKHYREYYDDECKEIIDALYAEDLRFFGYEY